METADGRYCGSQWEVEGKVELLMSQELKLTDRKTGRYLNDRGRLESSVEFLQALCGRKGRE